VEGTEWTVVEQVDLLESGLGNGVNEHLGATKASAAPMASPRFPDSSRGGGRRDAWFRAASGVRFAMHRDLHGDCEAGVAGCDGSRSPSNGNHSISDDARLASKML
jgi:hypothetical protein